MLQATPAPARPCQVWCTDHYTGAQPEDGFCRRRTEVDGVYLSATDDGPMVLAYSNTRDELTLDQAETYGRALLDLVDAARTAVAA
ncbi:hypothetical protein OIE13_05775 [Streptosporangium sp. NBC_01810]|uniref:hypothetical protein n=1 Tax=Streptosporangium sp. NBC_01810 TaxID=2975951 RepID=UPI002DDA6313|nr:hypothetical protein [Streptosporangium sp. NBC_01810]WSA27381.1 hypothetical protein OIE13_05775 [Streptosporangium sp. NBC_01810]